MDVKENILNIIRQKNTQLPTLPVIVDNILNIARDETTSAKDLADFIEKDQAITAKVLRLANSAYYGLMKEVGSISRAIAIIGFNEVIGITIGMNVFSVFGKKDANNIFDMEKLWLHSITCATAARDIATRKRIGEVDKLFLVGLLHDIGKVIFSKYLPEEYGNIFQKAKNSEVSLHRLEKEAFGIDHAVLSGVLMKRWNFPENLLLPSHFHHNSISCPPFYQTFALIVELADYVSLKSRIGGSGNSVPPMINDISDKLGFSSEEVKLIEEELRNQKSSIEEFLKLISLGHKVMEADKKIIAKLEGENKLLRNQAKIIQNRFEEQIDELSMIRELGEGLLSAQNFEPLCEFILNFIIEHTVAQNCSIMLLDSDTDQLFFACASDYHGKAYAISAKDIFTKNNLQYSFKRGQGAAGHTVDFKKPILINDVNTSPLFDSEHNGIGNIASLLSVPLLLGDEPLGVLNLSHSEIEAFESSEINLFCIIANVVAIAIQNTLNFESLRSEISIRKKVEEKLKNIHGELEERIQERTNELTQSNDRLNKEMKHKEIAQSSALKAKEQAERANKAKSDFLANMSHELRTPLNHIIGFTELVADEHFGAVNDLQNEYLSDVLTSSKHLLDLINDILDLSKIEAGKLELELSDIILKDLLNASLTMIKEKALVHGIRLERDVNGVPDIVRMDERKVKQILYNLLSNAAKFTPDGGKIILSVHTIEGIVRSGYRWSDSTRVQIFEKPYDSIDPHENCLGKCLQFSVTDSGIGIEKADKNRIFHAFEQADGLNHQTYTGTGLGLSLSKKLVELHGGKIWVESEGKNKGSTFNFVIPIDYD